MGDASKPVISGGQRKRVNIGMELAAAPMALFLDEPTSGLDAASAAAVVSMLKHISQLGVTTVAVIHQPRQQVFEATDNVLLLGEGHQLYAGPTHGVKRYFSKLDFTFPSDLNPADTVVDIISGNGHQYNTDSAWRNDSVSKLIKEWQGIETAVFCCRQTRACQARRA